MPKKFLFIYIILLALLALRFHSFYSSHSPYVDGQKVRLEVTLQEEPELSNKGQNFSIKTPTNQIIFVRTKPAPRLSYGERLVVEGEVKEKVLGNSCLASSTRPHLDPLLKGEGELSLREREKEGNCRSLFTMYFPQITVVEGEEHIVTAAAREIRQRSKELFDRTLPPVSANLLSGIVFGAKERFPDEFKDSLRSTGVLHVIAASGTNVMFVAAFLLFTLGLFMRRQLAIVISMLGIGFYVVLAGADAPIIRASIMGALVFTASLLGRQSIGLFFLLLAGYVMLLWRPSFLFDVGFQLSFMATLGILVMSGKLGPPSLKATASQRILGVLGESVSTTFAAQVATVPILLGVFGSLGLLSLPVNVLVLWTVPILMVLGGVAVILGFIFAPLAQLVLYLSLPFLLFFEAVVSWFGQMKLDVQLESFPWQMAVGYYLVVGAVFLFIKKNNRK